MTVHIGVIGVGMIGKSHINAYAKVPGAKLVAVADLNEAEAQRVAAANNIPNAFANFRDLLAMGEIDAVDVCLHNNLHAPVTIEAMRQGKNVYCEKPMAGSWLDAKAIYDAARETGRMLHIQLGFLYSDETRAAKRLIDNGRLGKMYHMRSYGFRRLGRPYVDGYATKEFVNTETAAGGAMFDMGVYHISQLLFLANLPKLERITGHTYAEVELDPVRKEISRFNVEELGCGFAHFEDGLTMDILESWAIHMNPFPGSLIAGTQGGIRFEPFSFHSIVDDMEMDSTFNLGAMHYRNDTVHADREMPYNSSQKHWIAAQQGLCPLLPTAEIALDTQLIQEGIYFSHALGREVYADEIRSMSVSKALDIPNLFL
jgi:predicted dehydrogenase